MAIGRRLRQCAAERNSACASYSSVAVTGCAARLPSRCSRSGPGVETDSAGLAPDADVPLDTEQLNWAEMIFVMERSHQRRLSQRFGAHLRGKRVVCLDIPDDYAFMQPELVALLEKRAGPYLRR